MKILISLLKLIWVFPIHTLLEVPLNVTLSVKKRKMLMWEELSCHIWLLRRVQECLPQIIIQSDHWKFEIFSSMKTVFTIKSTEDVRYQDQIIIWGKH